MNRYVEPFAGSLAVLLAAPQPPRSEIVNDIDCLLANFWRAVKRDPAGVALHACDPMNEADLNTRHKWLVRIKPELAALIELDPEACDARAAGWWVWGISQWIGIGWCASGKVPVQKPSVIGVGGVFAGCRADCLDEIMETLAHRIRKVRVLCGDWRRAVTKSIVTLPREGIVGVFLDPPYHFSVGRSRSIYANDDGSVSTQVRAWAIEHGDNPAMRIALCGYQGEHKMPRGWAVHSWKATGGFSRGPNTRGGQNRHRERIWFSPNCLK